MHPITREQVLQLFHYYPRTGLLYWKKVRGSRRVEIPAGCINGKGYRVIGILRKLYSAHRLIWLIETGQWPRSQLDHINRVKRDNCFSNLRECNTSQNMSNRGLQANNTSGFKGVSRRKGTGKWEAYIRVDGMKVYLGLYSTAEEAAQRRDEAALSLQREFSVPNTRYSGGEAA